MGIKQTLPPSVESVLPYAMRYAMGRKTYAVTDVVDALLDFWDSFTTRTHQQIRRDLIDQVSKEVHYNNIRANKGDGPSSLFGHKCDRYVWMRLFAKLAHSYTPIGPGVVGFCNQDILGVVVDVSDSISGYRFVDGGAWNPDRVPSIVGVSTHRPVPNSQWTPAST